MKLALPFLAGGGALLTAAMLVTAGWDFPPVDSIQTGYRGTGMVQSRDVERLQAYMVENEAPEAPWELDTTGPRARDVYENVPLLGHLGEDQFNRLMAAITEWVSPEEGCAYCHNEENLASDEVYTKDVSRKMIQMTQAINSDWSDHVLQAGVTCHTCHRGEPVPANIWFSGKGDGPAKGMLGYTGGQNTVGVATTSLHADPFSPLLGSDGEIRVSGLEALPSDNTASIQQTERTYALMAHMSEGLGVNCTFCHNTRSFDDWSQSTPQRMTAFHGIQMVRELNNDHLGPLTSAFPAERLGPNGDVAKVNCTTCHQGVSKPLLGANMVEAFPSLQSGN